MISITFDMDVDIINATRLYQSMAYFGVIIVTHVCRQAALERQDLSCMYLAHHELQSVFIIIIYHVCMCMQASTRGNPEMVLKWDSQLAMKPIAFDQDDHVRSEDAFLDIAVVSRGGRLNSGWKKVKHYCFMVIS